MSKDNLDALMYINEMTSPEDNTVKNMNVVDKNGVFYVEFESAVHSFDVINRNARMYKANNIASCLKSERIQHYLSHGGWFGEMDHPISFYKDRPLSPERIKTIVMSNTSHKLMNPEVKGNLLVSRIQTDSGTEAGRNLANKMVQGFIPGFSCRAIATLIYQNNKPVVDVKQVICYDWVLFQSHVEAEQNTSVPNKYVDKHVNAVTESTDVAIPIREILEKVGQTNYNAQVVMESFDLTNDDLIGMTPDNRHLMIRDHNNVIYCGVDNKTRNRVSNLIRKL